jgi:hypothetical protein
MCEVLQDLVGAFSKAHEADRQNGVEAERGGGVRIEDLSTGRFSSYQDYTNGVYKHIGTDLEVSPGTMIRSSVKGTVVYVDSPPSMTYGTMAVTIRVDLDEAVSLPLRYGGQTKTSVVYLTYGHMRPSRNQQPYSVPSKRLEAGKSDPDFTLRVNQSVQVGQTLGFIEGFGPSEVPDGEFHLYYFGEGTDPHLHLTMTTSGAMANYLAGRALESGLGIYLDALKALPLIKKHMK